MKTFLQNRDKRVSWAFQLVGIIIPVIFAILIGYYNYLMVQSYNYTVFDLGLGYRLMFLFYHSHTIIWSGTDIIFSPIPYSKLIFIPLSMTFFLNNSLYMPLLLQIIVISLGGYALFVVSKIKTGSYFLAVSLEIMYFLYPATYGFMANGANYVGYLASFIIIGYLFYLKKKYYLAFLFFFLASISNTWGSLIVIVFLGTDTLANNGLLNLIKSTHVLSKIKNYLSYKRSESLFLLFTVISSALVLSVVVFLEGGIASALGDSRLNGVVTSPTHGAGSSLLNQYLNGFGTVKLPFLNAILSPFLYLPALTIYFIPVLIYLLLVWSASPEIAAPYFDLSQHYSYLFIAFVFVGVVHFFKNGTKGLLSKKLMRKLLIVMVLSSLVSFALNSPFSINNFQNGTVHNLSDVSAFDKDLTHGLDLIPINSTVFIQNDIPQLMNRANVYMPGYYNNQSVGYAVIIPFGFSPISSAYSGYSLYWAQHFQSNSSYGIYEEIENSYVYKLGYKGNPAYFIPMHKKITVGVDGLMPVNKAKSINETISVSNITSGETLWVGGYTNFYPGTYKITYELKTSIINPKNQLNAFVMFNNGVEAKYFNNLVLNGTDFLGPNEWTNFTTSVSFNNFNSGLGVQFQASSAHWNGTVGLRSITIRQIN